MDALLGEGSELLGRALKVCARACVACWPQDSFQGILLLLDEEQPQRARALQKLLGAEHLVDLTPAGGGGKKGPMVPPFSKALVMQVRREGQRTLVLSCAALWGSVQAIAGAPGACAWR